MRALIQGHSWSEHQPIDITEKVQVLKSIDINGNTNTILVEEDKEMPGVKFFYFYSKAFFLNLSPFNFEVITNKAGNDNNAQRLVVSGQTPVEPDEDFTKELIIFSDFSGDQLFL